MRRARYNLEEQVGGLIDAGGRRERRREHAKPAAPDPVEPQRYPLTARATVAIRAARAADEQPRRQVA